MGRKSTHNAMPRNGKSFDSWHKHPQLPPRDYLPEKVIAARKRIEDLKMAREIGVPLSEIL